MMDLLSRPARGAWIEINVTSLVTEAIKWSRPARGAWIEIGTAARS